MSGVSYYPDETDTACTVGQRCSANVGIKIPALRGLCVDVSGTKTCWDACNTNHLPDSYSTDANAKEAIALMIKQIRTGAREESCSGATLTSTCNEGDRCTPPGLTLYRGMCVSQGTTGPQCLDMCDTKIDIAKFKMPGKPVGVITTVNQVRAGQDPMGYTECPLSSVWLWLWFPLLLCILIGCCGIAYYMYNYYRRNLRRNKNHKGPDEEQFMQEDDYQAQPQYGGPEDPMPAYDPAPAPAPTYEAPMERSLEPPVEAAPATTTTDIFGTPNLFAQGPPSAYGGSMNLQGPRTMMPPGYGQASFAGSNMGSHYAAAPYGAYGGQAGGFQPTSSMRIH